MSLLAAIDFADSIHEIVDQAVILSRALDQKVYFIYVENYDPAIAIEGGPLLNMTQVIAEKIEDDEFRLKNLVEGLREKGVDADYCLEKGETALKIIEKAQALKVEMIVIGTHGRTMLMDLLTGSTHEGVLHRAECPVLVVPLKKS